MESSVRGEEISGPWQSRSRRRRSLQARGCSLCCSVGGASCVCADGAARLCSIESFYETRRLVGALCAIPHWRRVALLLPDGLLPDAPFLLETLKALWRQQQTETGGGEALPESVPFFYFCGDRPAGQCCVDFVGASLLQPDVIVHFGNSCCSRPAAASPKPILFFGTRAHLDVASCASALKRLLLLRSEASSAADARNAAAAAGGPPATGDASPLNLNGEGGEGEEAFLALSALRAGNASPCRRSQDEVETDAGSEQPGRPGLYGCCTLDALPGERGLLLETPTEEASPREEGSGDERLQQQRPSASRCWWGSRLQQLPPSASGRERAVFRRGALLVVQSEFAFALPCLLQHLASTGAFANCCCVCMRGCCDAGASREDRESEGSSSPPSPSTCAKPSLHLSASSAASERSLSSLDEVLAADVWRATNFFVAWPPSALLPLNGDGDSERSGEECAVEIGAALSARREKDAYRRDALAEEAAARDGVSMVVDGDRLSSATLRRGSDGSSSACLLVETKDNRDEAPVQSEWGELFELPPLLNKQLRFSAPLGNWPTPPSPRGELAAQTAKGGLLVVKAKKLLRVAGRPVFSVWIRSSDEALCLRPVTAAVWHGQDDPPQQQQEKQEEPLHSQGKQRLPPSSDGDAGFPSSLPSQLGVSSLSVVLLGKSDLSSSSLEENSLLHPPLTAAMGSAASCSAEAITITTPPPPAAAPASACSREAAAKPQALKADAPCLCAERKARLASPSFASSEIERISPSPLLLRLLLRHGGSCRLFSLDPSMQPCPAATACSLFAQSALCAESREGVPGLCDLCACEGGGTCCQNAVLVDEAARAASQLARHFASLRGVESSRHLSLLLLGQQTPASLATHAGLVQLASEETRRRRAPVKREAGEQAEFASQKSGDSDLQLDTEDEGCAALPCLSVAGAVSVAVGEATTAKLLNFFDTDAFCLLGCAESCLLLRLRQKDLGLECLSLVLPVDVLVASGCMEWQSDCLVESEEVADLLRRAQKLPEDGDGAAALPSTSTVQRGNCSSRACPSQSSSQGPGGGAIALNPESRLACIPTEGLRLQRERAFQGVAFGRPADLAAEAASPLRLWKGRDGVASVYAHERQSSTPPTRNEAPCTPTREN